MTIKKRLIFSYLAMLLVPFILIMVTGGVLRYFSTENTLNKSSMGSFSNSRYSHFPIGYKDLFDHLNQVILKTPSLLFSTEYMRQLETSLNLPGAFTVLQKNEIMYKSPNISSQTIFNAISGQSTKPANRNHMDTEILFRWEFSIPEQENGVLYYLIDPKLIFSKYFSRGLFFTIAVALILVITNGTLTYMVSRSIILPLKELENAANKIRDGDLDSSVAFNVDNEMKDVFSSFNEMRERLKNSLEKQISYEENRKELFASISHDLRTPLTVLKGYVEGLRDGVASTDEKKILYLNTIYQKAHQMDHLIDDLFLFSRLEMDKYPFNPVPLDLSGWLADAVADLSVDYPKIDFKTNLIKNTVISADPAELFRVISNIVQNSNNYADQENIVIIFNLKIVENQAQISISDNGKGVQGEQLPVIFDHFYQGDESRSKKTEGSGLGLSIARMIINQHKGTIRAESTIGKGLTVIITIPLVPKIENTGSSGLLNG